MVYDHMDSFEGTSCLLNVAFTQVAAVLETCTMQVAVENAQGVTHTSATRDRNCWCGYVSPPLHWLASEPWNGESWSPKLAFSCG